MWKSCLVKIIRTASFDRLAKKKDWDPNPWAVCTDSVGREDPEKYERCIQKVKQKQDCKDKKKKEPDAVLTSKMVEPFKR